jgi:hypothetical protein
VVAAAYDQLLLCKRQRACLPIMHIKSIRLEGPGCCTKYITCADFKKTCVITATKITSQSHPLIIQNLGSADQVKRT